MGVPLKEKKKHHPCFKGTSSFTSPKIPLCSFKARLHIRTESVGAKMSRGHLVGVLFRFSSKSIFQTCITQSRERRGLMKSTKEFWSKKQFDKSSHYSDWLISRTHHSKGRKSKEVRYPMLLRQLKVYSTRFFRIYSCQLMFIALAFKVFFF